MKTSCAKQIAVLSKIKKKIILFAIAMVDEYVCVMWDWLLKRFLLHIWKTMQPVLIISPVISRIFRFSTFLFVAKKSEEGRIYLPSPSAFFDSSKRRSYWSEIFSFLFSITLTSFLKISEKVTCKTLKKMTFRWVMSRHVEVKGCWKATRIWSFGVKSNMKHLRIQNWTRCEMAVSDFQFWHKNCKMWLFSNKCQEHPKFWIKRNACY